MNKLLQRTYQRTQWTIYKPIFNSGAKHYQAQMMRQPIQEPIIIFIQEPIIQEPIIQEPIIQKKQVNEWGYIEAKAKEDARKLNEYLENRPALVKKPIMTPNGIRTEPLVIPGRPVDEFKNYEARVSVSAMKLNEYLENRPPLVKKPIMTPNGIRTEPLVIPGAPENQFAFIMKQADKSLDLMNKSQKRKFTVHTTHEKDLF